MSIGFRLQAKRTEAAAAIEPGALLRRIEQTVARFLDVDVAPIDSEPQENGSFAIWINPFHVAPPLELILHPDGSMRATGVTGSMGPGYHIFLIELLRVITAEVGYELGAHSPDEATHLDEAGYIDHGDAESVRMFFEVFLRALCLRVLEDHPEDDTLMGTQLCMPMDEQFTSRGVITPMGPRDREWLRRVIAGEEDIDTFFPWASLELDAVAHRGIALATMWQKVRWRPPVTDEEQAVLQAVADSLEAAHREDPSLDLPWHEWEEVLGLLHRHSPFPKEMMERTSEPPGRDPIGYRRLPVITKLGGGWDFIHDGSLGSEIDEKGNLCLPGPRYTVHATAFHAGGRNPRDIAEEIARDIAEREGMGSIELDGPDYMARGAGGIRQDPDDRDRTELVAHVIYAADGPSFLMMTVAADSDTGEDELSRILRNVHWNP